MLLKVTKQPRILRKARNYLQSKFGFLLCCAIKKTLLIALNFSNLAQFYNINTVGWP